MLETKMLTEQTSADSLLKISIFINYYNVFLINNWNVLKLNYACRLICLFFSRLSGINIYWLSDVRLVKEDFHLHVLIKLLVFRIMHRPHMKKILHMHGIASSFPTLSILFIYFTRCLSNFTKIITPLYLLYVCPYVLSEMMYCDALILQ